MEAGAEQDRAEQSTVISGEGQHTRGRSKAEPGQYSNKWGGEAQLAGAGQNRDSTVILISWEAGGRRGSN